MSARERIEDLWSRGFAVGPYLDAYRGEVLREAAAKQRALPLSGAEAGVRDALANLIDPDKDTE